jgi:type III pantothenate kinase
VIDFGSATTLTAVSPQGKFLGGWITLGIGKTLAALNQGIAMLPDVQSKIESTKNFALGMNPEDAIIRGTLLAHAAAIDAWIDAARDELGLDAVVVATGGYSTKISPLCKRISNADPLLTLKGVDLIAEAAMGRADLV